MWPWIIRCGWVYNVHVVYEQSGPTAQADLPIPCTSVWLVPVSLADITPLSMHLSVVDLVPVSLADITPLSRVVCPGPSSQAMWLDMRHM